MAVAQAPQREAAASLRAIPHLDAAAYVRHPLHRADCLWSEKNCYVDVWIELIHALGQEPLAALPFTCAIDFEGDQWTFFKPPHEELRELYGLDVQELNVWRPLLEHARDYLAVGKLISTEADAFWLPDTAGTDYRRKHTKSTIILAELDLAGERLGYFHNAGYFLLEGEDFARTFRIGLPPDPQFMPLFAEVIRTDRLIHLPAERLRDASLSLWRKHLARVPGTNPVERFGQRLGTELTAMHGRGLDHYHAWAFATVRQLGSAFELAAANLRWLEAGGLTGLGTPVEAFELIASHSKTLILKGARAVNTRRSFNGDEMLAAMTDAWQRGISSLAATLG
ncbi:MAG: DUF1839 family protein [Sinobacteraceae bacterium]|nr:DUF1839 family protein [Nevskiaceae bacterium]